MPNQRAVFLFAFVLQPTLPGLMAGPALNDKGIPRDSNKPYQQQLPFHTVKAAL